MKQCMLVVVGVGVVRIRRMFLFGISALVAMCLRNILLRRSVDSWHKMTIVNFSLHFVISSVQHRSGKYCYSNAHFQWLISVGNFLIIVSLSNLVNLSVNMQLLWASSTETSLRKITR